MLIHALLLTVLAPLALVLPLGLAAALCLPAPSLALSALAALSQLRRAGAGLVPLAPRGQAPPDVFTHPP